MNKLIWDESFAVGEEIIDDQHKELFDIYHQLVDSVELKVSKDELYKHLISLLSYVETHFKDEEKFFQKGETFREHKEEHQKFTLDIGGIISQIMNEADSEIHFAAELLLDPIQSWITTHILGTDKRTFTILHKETGFSHSGFPQSFFSI